MRKVSPKAKNRYRCNRESYSAFHQLGRKVLKMRIWGVPPAVGEYLQQLLTQLEKTNASKPCDRVYESAVDFWQIMPQLCTLIQTWGTSSTIRARLPSFLFFIGSNTPVPFSQCFHAKTGFEAKIAHVGHKMNERAEIWKNTEIFSSSFSIWQTAPPNGGHGVLGRLPEVPPVHAGQQTRGKGEREILAWWWNLLSID